MGRWWPPAPIQSRYRGFLRREIEDDVGAPPDRPFDSFHGRRLGGQLRVACPLRQHAEPLKMKVVTAKSDRGL
jgi:hypothetical protein